MNFIDENKFEMVSDRKKKEPAIRTGQPDIITVVNV